MPQDAAQLFLLLEQLEDEIIVYLELKALAMIVETCKAAAAKFEQRLNCIRSFHVIIIQARTPTHLQSYLKDQELASLAQCCVNLKELTIQFLQNREEIHLETQRLLRSTSDSDSEDPFFFVTGIRLCPYERGLLFNYESEL